MTFTDLNDALLVFEKPDHPGWQAAYDYLVHDSEAKDLVMEVSRVAMKATLGYPIDEFAFRSDAMKRTVRQFEKATGRPLFQGDPVHLVQ